jgi:hypothetical protein
MNIQKRADQNEKLYGSFEIETFLNDELEK